MQNENCKHVYSDMLSSGHRSYVKYAVSFVITSVGDAKRIYEQYTAMNLRFLVFVLLLLKDNDEQ